MNVTRRVALTGLGVSLLAVQIPQFASASEGGGGEQEDISNFRFQHNGGRSARNQRVESRTKRTEISAPKESKRRFGIFSRRK